MRKEKFINSVNQSNFFTNIVEKDLCYETKHFRSLNDSVFIFQINYAKDNSKLHLALYQFDADEILPNAYSKDSLFPDIEIILLVDSIEPIKEWINNFCQL